MIRVLIGFAVGLLLFTGVVCLLVRGALRRTPAAVVKTLRHSPAEHRLEVGRWPRSHGTWNPAEPLGPDNALRGPGSAVYRLDAHSTVHLHWKPDSGPVREFAGAIPEAIEPGSAQQRRTRFIVTAVIAGYLALIAIGFTVGFALSSGPTSIRIGWGLAGLAAASIVLWMVSLIINVVISTRRVLNHSQDREEFPFRRGNGQRIGGTPWS